MSYQFVFDSRLGIEIPDLQLDWHSYSIDEQHQILLEWEGVRSKIPDRIIALEKMINKRQAQLAEEENFAVACQLVHDIHDLASIINDLNIWFRIQQDVEPAVIHR